MRINDLYARITTMEPPSASDIERAWRHANDAFKELDQRYKSVEIEIERLRGIRESLLLTRTRSPKEELFDELQQREDDLRIAAESAVEVATERFEAEVEEIWAQFEQQKEQLLRELEPRIAPYREITVDDDGETFDSWDDYYPAGEFHSPEFDAAEKEIGRLKALLRELSGPRIEARRALKEARERKLEFRR